MGKRGPLSRLGDATWGAMRDEYVTGNESYPQLAKRYGVTSKAVEKHALNRAHPTNGGRTWGEWRTDFRRRTSDRVENVTTTIAARTLAEVREKSANVAKLALDELERRLATTTPDGDPATVLVETKDLIQAAKLATAIKLELSGDPNNPTPVLVEQSLDALTIEELRKLAGGT